MMDAGVVSRLNCRSLAPLAGRSAALHLLAIAAAIGSPARLALQPASGAINRQFRRDTTLGSVIADDMGLGKTLQGIAALLRLRQDGALGAEAAALIVVPTSLLGNWQRELQRFAPALSVGVFHGSQRKLTGADATPGQRPDVLLTSYGLLRSQTAGFKALDWLLLIADEAQNIKKPAAEQTHALKAVHARSCIAISGTPVEKRLSGYWSIMDFANRGYLGRLKRFDSHCALPIQMRRGAARRRWRASNA